MGTRGQLRLIPVLFLLLLGGVLLGCVDTEKIYVQQPLFEDPPAASGGFLGYSDVEKKVPVCGNCHIDHYGKWKDTKHAHAWEDLQASGHATSDCEACHSVGANGNVVVDQQVGWTGTRDPRYQDVQCEACHGPGLQHVTNPETSQPLASIEVGVDLTAGCGECHQGTHNPFVEEWSQSRHGRRDNHASTNPSCVACHEARGVFAAWGINTNFIEKTGHDDPIPITCPVCHDPHNATNAGQLRYPIDVPDVETNLCMKCHHRRSEPDLTRPSSGPHSPQGPLLLGVGVGWIPPSFTYPPGSIVATHGTERNPRLCAGCHVNRMEITDPLTGDFVLNSSGHLFKPIPCLDAQGVPTANDDCTLEQRSFQACTASGCHGTEDAARTVFTVAQDRILGLADELNALLDEVPASEFDNNDGRLSTAEGASFNAKLAVQPGSKIHNPFLVEALLTASIKQVEMDYNLQPVSSVSLKDVLGGGRFSLTPVSSVSSKKIVGGGR